MINPVKKRLLIWLAIVLIVAIVLRAWLFINYPPVSYSDTYSYRRSAVASSLIDHGDNPRFLVPLQTVVVFLVLWAAYRSWEVWILPKRKKVQVING